MPIDFPNSPTNGQTLVVGTSTYTWNSTAGTWDLTTTVALGPTGPTGPTGVAGATGPAGTSARFTPSDTPPSSPTAGDAWYNSLTGRLYVYYDSFWVESTTNNVGPTGPAGTFYVSDTAPASPTTGSTWFNSAEGIIYVYIGTAWVEADANRAGPTGPTGPTGAVYVNLDGGIASSIYGGIASISGGNASGN